jgi:hypothetical protein
MLTNNFNSWQTEWPRNSLKSETKYRLWYTLFEKVSHKWWLFNTNYNRYENNEKCCLFLVLAYIQNFQISFLCCISSALRKRSGQLGVVKIQLKNLPIEFKTLIFTEKEQNMNWFLDFRHLVVETTMLHN